ncbi:PTPA-CTERM sorting domain-containing protein [Leptolyngbya sp. NK1-12]|uniref:PTPA-CTERM sorting domain-containing protein n=1 Tax=Leptolyngbya sp. NK1-12 TaxID=2547451 RepID=A0AA96WLD8_9CYAN|nr:PTPA-CTERM sorting domain-containing protein [Leptolyngbya sp. NK1-12]WNZ27289.1 PTPA-CTERM sorting domain-containing protein [Leptolyngbya sp. NK1-12]
MNLKTLSLLTAAGLAVAVAAEPVRAISFGVSPDGNQFTTTVAGATTLTFSDVATPSASPINYTKGLASYSGNGRFVAGSIGGRYAEPPNNQPAYLTLGAGQEPGPVRIDFSTALNYFGLYWGSIDSFNSISFFSQGKLLKTIVGSDIRNPANGNQQLTGARFVDFFADAGKSFDRIDLISSSAAFESDNHAYRAVPTPALLPGLIAMGAAALRKRKGEQSEQPEEVKA